MCSASSTSTVTILSRGYPTTNQSIISTSRSVLDEVMRCQGAAEPPSFQVNVTVAGTAVTANDVAVQSPEANCSAGAVQQGPDAAVVPFTCDSGVMEGRGHVLFSITKDGEEGEGRARDCMGGEGEAREGRGGGEGGEGWIVGGRVRCSWDGTAQEGWVPGRRGIARWRRVTFAVVEGGCSRDVHPFGMPPSHLSTSLPW